MVQIWIVNKKFVLHFVVDILPLGYEAVDPHIFVDPDPGSQIMQIQWILSTDNN